MTFVSTQDIEIRLVQNDAKQVLIHPPRFAEHVFHHIDFRSPPLNDENEQNQPDASWRGRQPPAPVAGDQL